MAKTELEQWDSDIFLYNEEYEKANFDIKEYVKTARRLLHAKKPTTEVADALTDISFALQKLVDLNAEAGYNYRGIKNFYERSLIRRKHEIMAEGEKKVAANVAEGQAVIDCQKEFEIYNIAERYMVTCQDRYDALKELIASLRTKLEYGYKP